MTAGLITPVPNHPITQPFDGTYPSEPYGYLQRDTLGAFRARRVPFTGGVYHVHLHKAIDIGCPVGTPIRAPEAGVVVARGTIQYFPDGRVDGEHYLMLLVNRTATTHTILFFSHLYAFRSYVGQRVVKGQTIALSGASGHVTGPHLHWEVRVGPIVEGPLMSWGKHWTWYNPQRCMEGKDLATRAFLVPNV